MHIESGNIHAHSKPQCESFDWSYQFLDHLHALSSHVLQVVVDTQCSLSVHLLHDHVQEDEGPCAAYPCTAVDQERLVHEGWVLSADSPDETNY